MRVVNIVEKALHMLYSVIPQYENTEKESAELIH